MNKELFDSISFPCEADTHLCSLRDSIRSDANIGYIIESCKSITGYFAYTKFPFVYAGILLAKYKKTENAIQIIEYGNLKNGFATALSRYLKTYKTLTPSGVVFNNTAVYDTWCSSNFYKEYNKTTVSVIAESAADCFPTKKTQYPVIVDIGTGNGFLLANIVNSLVNQHELKGVNLILIDQSIEMLKKAEKHCADNIIIPKKIACIYARAEEMLINDFKSIKNEGPVWFVNAAASIHHMDRPKKIEVLKKISDITPCCFITDFEANHDTPTEDSPEFVYSVVQHYNYYIEDLLKSTGQLSTIWECIDKFLLAEAIVMLINDKSNRVDYHATTPEWKEIVLQSGLNIKKISHPIKTSNGRPLTLFISATQDYKG